MQINGFYIARCKQLIEKKLEWGDSASWRTRDFENLSSIIFEQTGISLSTSTLRRIWGHNNYDSRPNPTTLDTLAMFAGFTDWRTFQKSVPAGNKASALPEPASHSTPPTFGKRNILLFCGFVAVALLTAIAVNLNLTKETFTDADQFVFETKQMTGGIPNSVVFTYHVPRSVKDSIYIQQSWDSTRRVNVSLLDSTHTSIYYEPGIHHAKLMVGNRVVKEETLMIKTEGWTGLIKNRPIPIYLDSTIYMRDRYIAFEPSEVRDYGIDMRSFPKSVQFFNIGNFDPIPIKDLYFSTDLKHGYGEGASACQFSNIILFTDEQNPLFIPISQKGCISDLNLLMPDTLISGKKHDLSGFGTDISQWTRVSCETSNNGTLIFGINGEVVFEAPVADDGIKIVGIAYLFYGTGAFRNILLRRGHEGIEVFKDLF